MLLHAPSDSTISVLFFFQAEDGIRDIGVTGVQTCALPICRVVRAGSGLGVVLDGEGGDVEALQALDHVVVEVDVADHHPAVRDRKSVVLGKSVDLGGRRIIKKKNNNRTCESPRVSTK